MWAGARSGRLRWRRGQWSWTPDDSRSRLRGRQKVLLERDPDAHSPEKLGFMTSLGEGHGSVSPKGEAYYFIA